MFFSLCYIPYCNYILGLDVAVYTKEKRTRPWIGRVTELVNDEQFKIHWYSGSKNSFKGMQTNTEEPYCSIVDNSSVILWGFSHDQTDQSFKVKRVFMEQIMSAYSYHDGCYF